MEVWKPVRDFEDYYAVSNMGNVKALSRSIVSNSRWGCRYTRTLKERMITPVDNGTGYLQVRLWVNGKSFAKYVHQLVVEAFINKPRSDYEVDHIDNDKTNNSVENLAWISHSENMRKCHENNPHIINNLIQYR